MPDHKPSFLRGVFWINEQVSRESRGWRAADAVMLVLFTVGAAVQVNDPDPVPWIVVYALAAAACLLSLLRRMHWTGRSRYSSARSCWRGPRRSRHVSSAAC